MSTFTASQMNGLQPILSDIATPNQMANKYQAQKYTVDDTALADRLGQYDQYNATQFGGLKDYLTGKADAVSGNTAFYKKNSLNDILGGLSGISPDKLTEMSPLLTGINSVGTSNGQSLYETKAINDRMNQYVVTPTDSALGSNLSDLKKLASINGYDYYGDSDPNQIAASLDPNTYNRVSGFLGGVQSPGFNDPRAISAGKAYYGDPWGFSHELQQVKDTPYYFAPQFQHTRSGTADTWYGLNPNDKISSGYYNGQYGYIFDPSQVDFSSQLTPERINDRYAEKKGGFGGGILGFLNNITEKYDPIGNFVTNNDAHMLGFDNRMDMIGQIGEPVGNALGIYFTGIPWGSILMGAQNASTGNWDAVGNNAINGIASYIGSNLGGGDVARTGFSLGSTAANAAANQALVSAATGALKGQKGSDILTNAIMSGLGSYGGSALGSAVGDMSPLTKMAANAAFSAGMSGINTSLRGGDSSRAMSNGALTGLTNSAIRQMLANKLYQ